MRNLSIFIFLMTCVTLATPSHAQDRTPQQDNANACYAAYAAARDNPLLAINVGPEWNNLLEANFEERANSALGHIGGIASLTFAESYAGVTSSNLANELFRYVRPIVLNAAVARAAHCDEIYGITPAITPSSEDANYMTERQAISRHKTPEEIVACNQIYEAGTKHPEVWKSPVAILFGGHADYDFFSRKFEMEVYADIADVYSRVADYIAYPSVEVSWEGRLSKGMETQDLGVQLAFLKEVSACDVSLDMRNPLTEGPLIEPRIAHGECGARYQSMLPFYAQSPQMRAYFQERMVMTGRYTKLLEPKLTDQEILGGINAAADARLQTYQTPDGQTDPRRVMQGFGEIADCDNQYGIPVTLPPDELRRAARMAD